MRNEELAKIKERNPDNKDVLALIADNEMLERTLKLVQAQCDKFRPKDFYKQRDAIEKENA